MDSYELITMITDILVQLKRSITNLQMENARLKRERDLLIDENIELKREKNDGTIKK